MTDATNVKVELSTFSLDILSNIVLTKMKENGIELHEKTLMSVVRYSMEAVELYKLNGNMKKKTVLDLIKKISKENLDAETSCIICSVVDSGLVENAIELIVSATKGELDLNKVKEQAIELAEDVAQEAATSCLTACLKRVANKK